MISYAKELLHLTWGKRQVLSAKNYQVTQTNDIERQNSWLTNNIHALRWDDESNATLLYADVSSFLRNILKPHNYVMKSEYFYNWSETIQGLILGSFYWGYVPTQVPGGNLAEKYGGKYVLGLGILSSSICTILIPVVVKAGDWPWLIALRIISGLGEGGTFPALNVLLAKWTPLSERASLGTLVYAGAQIGTVLGTAGGGFIISATQTWEYAFYIIGGLGIIWFILWVLLCYSDPQSHPYISNNEKAYLQKELSSVAKNTQETPWKTILTSTPVWAVVLIFVGHSWGLLIMISHLPKYMSTILKFDVKESGIWSSCPHLAMWIVSMLSAPLCDWLIVKEYMSITTARKFFSTIAMVGPGAFILAAGYAGCDQVTTVILFTAGMAFMGPYSCGMMVNVLDLSRNFSGSLMALANAISALTGIAGPYLAGALTEDQTLSQWKTVFWITFGIFLITNLVFIVYGSGETQWWDVVIVEPEDCSCSIEENTLNKPNTSNVI